MGPLLPRVLLALSATYLLGGCVFFGNPFDTDGDGTLDADDCAPEDPLLHEGDGDGDGWSSCGGDCDDRREAIHPGAAEICNGRDDDCDGQVGGEEIDRDADGWSECAGDCEPLLNNVSPDAEEVCDGWDTDCDGDLPADETTDADEDGSLLCADCDDADPRARPGVPEACDGVDTDCDGVVPATEIDVDRDGSLACADCDDQNPVVYPGATELCDGRDTDCDGSLGPDEQDTDGDGLGPCQGDCAPDDPDVHAGAAEICNGLDDDCDGEVPLGEDADADQDGLLDCEDCSPDDPDPFPGAGTPLPLPLPEECLDFVSRPADADAFASLPGAADGDESGAALVALGDLDGDGVSDFAVGAPYASGAGGAAAGRVVIYSGAAAAAGTATPLATVHGDAVGDHVGEALGALGDLDGDGRADLAVGAPGLNRGGATDAGSVGVFLGSALLGGAELAFADAAMEIGGAAAGDAFGASLAGAGDVDHDGVPDLLVGAPGHDAGGLNSGSAFVFLGARVLSGQATLAGHATARLDGAASGDALGGSVAGPGDVDGDGCDDVLVGAEWAGSSGAGRAYVWSGGDVRNGGSFAPITALAQVTGQAAFERAGSHVSGAGDVDGDGLADVLVGAPHHSGGSSNQGAVYVFLGSRLASGGSLPAGDADLRVTGPLAGARLGTTVAGAGDVDGDGRDDLLLGAALSSAGGVAVVPGCRVQLAAVLPLTSDAGFLEASSSTDRLGSGLAGAGDLDGDGLDDLLLGAWGWSDGAITPGRAVLAPSPYAAP